MDRQRAAVMKLVEGHRQQGRPIREVLASVGIARSTYYRWKQDGGARPGRRRSYPLTPEEKRRIEAVQEPIRSIGIGGSRECCRRRAGIYRLRPFMGI